MSSQWEAVADDTTRLEVPGGWLYRTVTKTVGRPAIAMCFVLDPFSDVLQEGPQLR